MKTCSLVLLGGAFALGASAQSFPDFHADADKGELRYVKNQGQLYDTDGAARPDVKYYAYNTPIGVYLREKSVVSLTGSTIDADTSSVDTLYRVNMTFADGYERNPTTYMPVPELRHYYVRDDAAVENVSSSHRVYYPAVWDYIDVHFHHGTVGPRMSFYIAPGGDPTDIKLEFTGQDSISVDLIGMLKIYVDEKWIGLPPAVAYQIGSGNTITELAWLVSYDHIAGSDLVRFDFVDYDPSLPVVFEIGAPPVPQQGGGQPEGNLSWSTTVGSEISTFSNMGDMIFGGDKLPDDDLVVTGMTGDNPFPATVGQLVTKVGWDVFISRFDYAPGDPNNDAKLLWTTFLIGGPAGSGQSGGHDTPTCIKYASQHDAIYVAGTSSSAEWPMFPDINPNNGSYYQSTRLGTSDGFIAKLDQAGLLLRSTLYGGVGADIINSIVADGFGRIFFFGTTNTASGEYAACGSTTGGLPLCNPTAGNYQQDDNAGGLDLFVARLNDDFELTWGSFIGGAGDDRLLDSDYANGETETSDWLAISGKSNGDLPFETIPNSFQLDDDPGSSDPTGFVWLFRSAGRPGWGTHLHGTNDAQAVCLTKDEVRVAGVTIKAPPVDFITEACLPVESYFSVCSGNAAIGYIANYVSQFDLSTFTLDYSTLLGDFVDARHAYVSSRYWVHLHNTNRDMDMVANADDDYLLASTVAITESGEPNAYPMQAAWGMYQKAWDLTAGDQHTDVVLSLFSPTNELLWSSAFGAAVEHVDAGYDYAIAERGSDLVHSVVWKDGEVLYMVGSSGGHNFDRQCPYTPFDPSYCEMTAGPLDGIVDRFDGMIARFDMREVSVRIQEEIISDMLVAFPSPTSDVLSLMGPGWLDSRCTVEVIDVAGRLVFQQPLAPNGLLPVQQLAPGVYSVQVTAPNAIRRIATQFIKR